MGAEGIEGSGISEQFPEREIDNQELTSEELDDLALEAALHRFDEPDEREEKLLQRLESFDNPEDTKEGTNVASEEGDKKTIDPELEKNIVEAAERLRKKLLANENFLPAFAFPIDTYRNLLVDACINGIKAQLIEVAADKSVTLTQTTIETMMQLAVANIGRELIQAEPQLHQAADDKIDRLNKELDEAFEEEEAKIDRELKATRNYISSLNETINILTGVPEFAHKRNKDLEQAGYDILRLAVNRLKSEYGSDPNEERYPPLEPLPEEVVAFLKEWQ